MSHPGGGGALVQQDWYPDEREQSGSETDRHPGKEARNTSFPSAFRGNVAVADTLTSGSGDRISALFSHPVCGPKKHRK